MRVADRQRDFCAQTVAAVWFEHAKRDPVARDRRDVAEHKRRVIAVDDDDVDAAVVVEIAKGRCPARRGQQCGGAAARPHLGRIARRSRPEQQARLGVRSSP